MPDNIYHQHLRTTVIEACGENPVNDTLKKEAFLREIKSSLVDVGAVCDFSECIDKIYNDRRATAHYHIDGYYAQDEAAGVLELILIDWHDSEVIANLNKADMKTQFNKLMNFYNRAVQPDFPTENAEAQEIARRVYENVHSRAVGTIRLVLITNRRARGLALDKVEMSGNIRIEQTVIDLSRLRRFSEGNQVRCSIDIDIEEEYPKQQIKCIPTRDIAADNLGLEVYIGVIPGSILATLYSCYGPRLMESNVRSYLQGRGKINRGIMETAASKPQLFLAYNNGICCTASAVVPVCRMAVQSSQD